MFLTFGNDFFWQVEIEKEGGPKCAWVEEHSANAGNAACITLTPEYRVSNLSTEKVAKDILKEYDEVFNGLIYIKHIIQQVLL